MANKTKFEQVREFHQAFNCAAPEVPTPLSDKLANNRAAFMLEEVIELLHATAGNDERFELFFNELMDRAKETYIKQGQKPYPKDQLTGQVDSFTDILYFANGGFVEMGIEPDRIFSIVHEANMGKIFPDGKPHYNEVGKVIKPDNWEKDHAPEPKITAEINRQIESGANVHPNIS
ncbi:HAD family hydrolase [Paenibacillus sp. HJL G12]|uniref:HAD family hydrolase n=1 Tax=Paenibacillus dendrobii TaxID=2691084 RepID=A0A7X3IEP0_9BACL|nr:HAD family hydrolase [Paenibacillus dendrobii]MWV42193.1 HAD family hydrolase [Paenibacillus dendrobii]